MERAELERCIEDYHPASFGWALACCGRNREEAEDVLQAAYLKIFDGSARFDGRSTFKTWLFAVIRRTALQRHRWRRVRERIDRLLRLEDSSKPAEYTAETERLLRAMKLISKRQREVLELVFYHDMTIEEAARTLGISVGTARTHYERGKARLRKKLFEEGQIAFA